MSEWNEALSKAMEAVADLDRHSLAGDPVVRLSDVLNALLSCRMTVSPESQVAALSVLDEAVRG